MLILRGTRKPRTIGSRIESVRGLKGGPKQPVTNLGRALSAEEPPMETNDLRAGLLTWLNRIRTFSRCGSAMVLSRIGHNGSLTVAVTVRDSHPLPYSPRVDDRGTRRCAKSVIRSRTLTCRATTVKSVSHRAPADKKMADKKIGQKKPLERLAIAGENA